MRGFRIFVSVLSGFSLAACTGGTIYKKDTFGAYQVLSVDARQRLVLQGERSDGHGGTRTVICTEPSPDAIVAQAAQLAASANVPFGGDRVASGQLAGGFSEAAASIAMRTQTIQLLRDGYFRLCEAYLNGVLDKIEYLRVIMFIDEFIATVVAIEALGGTVTTAPVTIGVDGSATANKDSAEIETKTLKHEITVKEPAASTVNAQAIEAILKRYYIRKAEFQEKYSVFAENPNL
jgi:hypothetical protein